MTEPKKISIEDASQRWIEEGKTYKDAINSWLDVIYIDKENPTDPEPTESRKDMAPFVREQIIKMNKAGKQRELRQLFPPDLEPFGEELKQNFTYPAAKATILENGNIIARVLDGQGGAKVYLIADDSIELQADIIAYGHCHDKKYFCKAYPNKITITDGWQGDTVVELKYPKDYGQKFTALYPTVKLGEDFFSNPQINDIQVFADGKRLLLTGPLGIFIVGSGSAQLLHPDPATFKEQADDEMVEGLKEGFYLDYPHADLSPDELYIALGSQDSNHIVLKESGGRYEPWASIEPRSSYPHCVKFNYLIKGDDGKSYNHLALGSCHFSSSATIGVLLDNLTKDFSASGYDADKSLDYINDFHWVFSMLPWPAGYYLGDNNGYIWLCGFHSVQKYGYVHVGGSINSMDISKDRKTLVVATYSGQIVKLKWSHPDDAPFDIEKNNRLDPFLVTNLPWVDEKRYLFWKDTPPLVW